MLAHDFLLFPPALLLLVGAGFGQDFGDEVHVLSSLPSIRAITAMDADGDGDLDALISGSASGSEVGLLVAENLGDGTFALAQPLGPGVAGLNASFVASGDLDQDGDPDVVFTGTNGTRVGWCRNLGTSFSSPIPLASGAQTALDVQVADMDGDQVLDVLWIGAGGPVEWRRGLGGGAFAAAEELPSTAAFYTAGLVNDIDQDGDPDVLAVARPSGVIDWWENDGAGNFGPSSTLVSGLSRPESILAEDLDGDGDQDLMVGGGGTQATWAEVATLTNQGSLVFAVSATMAPAGVFGFELANLDGDSLPDLVLASSGPTSGSTAILEWFSNQGGAFGPPLRIGEGESYSSIAAWDLNGDGINDLLAAGGSYSRAWMGTGSGFSDGGGLVAGLTGSLERFVEASDLDRDGLGDLAMFGAVGAGTWGAVKNLRDGRWSSPSGQFSISTPLQGEVRDLDGDGDDDLIASGGSFNAILAYVAWASNDGSGGLPDFEMIYSGSADSGAAHAIGDMEGDGDLDVFWTHLEGFTGQRLFGWTEQVSPGHFAPGPMLPNNAYDEGILLADIDLDGDADLISSRGGAVPRIRWRANNGAGQFGLPTTIASGAAAAGSDIQLADLNGDGRTDVVVAGASGVGWFRGLSPAGFAPLVLIESAMGVDLCLVLRDVNRDGRVDLFLSTAENVSSPLSARWIDNLGGGAFAPATLLPEAEPGAIVEGVADFDGDLDLDVLKRRRNNTLVWNRNLRRFGDGYCGAAVANSAGLSAAMSARGSLEVAMNDVTLIAERLPVASFGYFLVAPESTPPTAVSGAQGRLCIGGAIGRLNRGPGEVFQAGANGQGSVTFDLTNVPTPTGAMALLPGDTRYFQAWYRDANPTVTSNFTNGLRLSFE